MASEEQPNRIKALQTLMAMLDEETPKAPVRYFGTLDKEIVIEAEDVLAGVSTGTFEDRTSDARIRVEDALKEWLDALGDSMHFRSPR